MVQVKVHIWQIKPPLVGEHAFPLMGFICRVVHVTFGGSGAIMTTARPELPYPWPSLGTRLLGGGSSVTVQSQGKNRYANYKLSSL